MSLPRAPWEVDGCILCDVLNEETWVPFRSLFAPSDAGSEVLMATDNFSVIADVGPIVEGYCLIIFRACVPSLACVTPAQAEELSQLKRRLRDLLRPAYGDIVFFEHGSVDESRTAGGCITHAHLHAVPLSADLSLLPSLAADLRIRPLNDELALLAFARRTGYVFYETQRGDMHFAEAPVLPSQYLRRVLSAVTGTRVPWSWRDHVRLAQALDTRSKIERLRAHFAAGVTA